MRILYVMPGFDEGGAEVHVLSLIRGMSRNGHEVTLASSGGRLEKDLPPSAKILHMPAHIKNPITIIYCAVKLAILNRKFHWDIIHAHSRVPAWVSWLASKLTGAKFIVTAHSLYSLNAGLIPYSHADGAICISHPVMTHLEGRLPSNAAIIPNGITPAEFHHRDFTHEGTTKFLIVGRLTRLKAVDVALNALAKLTGYSWTLDILGEGDERANLEALSAKLGISERVKFHGDMSKPDVDKFMAKSTCILFTSKSEGAGLVVYEALSAGLPVIASDIDAMREISAGKNGNLVMAGDVDEWQKAIERFILTGEASRINADIFTADEMTAKTEKYYLTVL